MKNKINIKKIVGWTCFILFVMWLIRFDSFRKSDVKEDLTSESRSKSSLPLAPIPTLEPTPILQPEVNKVQPSTGWIYDHKEVRPDSSFTYWYVPSDYSKETDLFKISNLNVGYRLKADAIIEFQSQSNPESFTAIRHEAETGLKFKKDEEGNFSIPYPESELQQLASTSEAFRFRPIGNNPMTGLKVSKVE